ncbi:MAG: protein-glutamate O-methyltransferase CheR [bacterium]
MDLEYNWFKRKIHEIAGIDLDSYRPEQMKRLMEKALDQAGAKNYVEFIKQIKGSPVKIQQFKDDLTINVSSLFRDLDRWMELNKFIPGIISGKIAAEGGGIKTENRDAPTLRAWSAGCSIGAEPYSLAILLEEYAASPAARQFSYSIFCTDLDREMVHRAKEGVFTDKETAEIPARLLQKYFRRIERPDSAWARKSVASQFYGAAPEIRSNLKFRIHNLLDERWEKGFDLIICRNVLIYFTREIKHRLFEKFGEALVAGGMLFIGGTEVIFTPGEFGLKNVTTGFYRKAELSRQT